MILTLAHLSDVHLGPLPAFHPRYWGLKRGLGYLNWQKNRRGAHRPEVLAALIEDLRLQAPGHIAVTGDLVNIGLPAEYEAALSWLEALGAPDAVTVVPGNHDIYVRMRREAGFERWHAYMRDAGAEASARPALGQPSLSQPAFPFVRHLGRAALIGLNSAMPTPPFVAAGELGPGQLQRLAQHLDQLGREGIARIVLIHHPPLPGQASRTKALRDAAALADVLAHHGAELVLHGHNHKSELWTHPHAGGVVPIVGVPSASLGHPHKAETLARYHLYRLDFTANQVAIEYIARGLREPNGPVVEIERRMLMP